MSFYYFCSVIVFWWLKKPFEISVGSGVAPARSSGCLFAMWCVHSSSGWITCPDGFCPEELPVYPATAMAAQIYECHEELLQGPCYLAEVSALLKEFSVHRLPEQGIGHLERSRKSLFRISPQLSQLFMSFLTRLSLWQMRENVFPKTYKERNNLASQNLLQKNILMWQLFLKWICRSSKAL